MNLYKIRITYTEVHEIEVTSESIEDAVMNAQVLLAFGSDNRISTEERIVVDDVEYSLTIENTQTLTP